MEALAPDVVCIDSPSQWAGPGRRRPAELELNSRGIKLYATPSEDQSKAFHSWMRDGFKVYGALADLYPRYTGGEVRGKAAEYYPHASAVALMGRIGVFADKAQIRRRLLAEYGVDTESLVGPVSAPNVASPWYADAATCRQGATPDSCPATIIV